MKKKNAIMIADTRPALIGNLLIQLQATNKGLFDEAIIYYETITEKDRKVMERIMPCRFIKFDYDLPDTIKELPSFAKFSPLMFSRYYMFDLLKEYETVTWLDTDVLIVGDLSPVIEKARIYGMSANFEDSENKSYKSTDIVKTSFSVPLMNYDMRKYNMSSGLITVSDNLKDYELMTKWCFEKTIEYADYLLLPDQGILNILIQEFKINVASVGEKGAYCFYPSYNRDASKAKIIHAWGARKFWRSWYLYNKFPDWKKYYNEWIKIGGSDIFGQIRPDISVVIPIFRPNISYLKELLDDLLINQVQEHGFQYDNFEIILVVDGKENDKLLELINDYDDPRIVLILNEEKAGIAKSLNIGIKVAKADYIARIDDDDRVASRRLYKQYKYLEEHPNIDLVTSNFAYFGDMNEERVSFDGEMAHAWSIFTCPFNHPTIMFRKSFFVDNDLFYDETRSHVEDWELWLRCFKKGMKVGNIPEILYFHRWHNGSAGQNQKTVDMMRELVKKNFAELKVDLTDDDLRIVPIWQGKTTNDECSRLINIFNQTLENNAELKIYDQESLRRCFELRLYEAQTGIVKDIVKKVNKIVPNAKNNRTLKQKLLGPIYRPFKRVFYNIMAEAVSDNIDTTGSKNEIKNNQENTKKMLKKIQDNNQRISDLYAQFYDLEEKYEFLKNNIYSNIYCNKKVILIGTSEHSNIGDAAITFGEYEFIRKYFSDYKIIEYSSYEFNENLANLMNIINKDDLIFLQGGGNLGNKYLVEENIRRTIISSFPNNKIVILPQTIYFDNDTELNISKDIYNSHNDLTLFTRGDVSLNFAKKHFKNAKNYKALDMALNLNYNYNFKRDGILCCIRDLDDESALNKEQYNMIFEIVNKYDQNYVFTNNLWLKDIKKIERNSIVYDQIKRFAQHKLVITDRLFGLIFSLITNTPCIVLSSYNYKLKEFTDMLKDNKSIKFIDKDIDKLDSEIKKMLKSSVNIHNDFSEWFDKIADIIKKG